MASGNSIQSVISSRYIFLTILAAVASIWLFKNGLKYSNKIENVLTGLLKEELSSNCSTDLPIAVGFGSCLDLKLSAIPLFNAMGIKPPYEPKYHENLKTMEDIAELFVFYFTQGAAVERFIPLQLLQELVAASEKIKHAEWAAGGNAPVMANRFVLEGFKNVVVGSKASKKLKSFFSSELQFLEGDQALDDIHLVLEYNTGEKWGPYTSVRANRFIVHSDRNNPYIQSLEMFNNTINEIRPRLTIVSALQMLDNFPFEQGARKERMQKLEEVLKFITESTLIHFEMASFSELAMMKSILEHVLPYVDSMGMNEQELPNLVNVIKRGEVTKVADSNPRTVYVLDDMRELYRYYSLHSKRGLSRIHVHTLAFQAILTKKSSSWQSGRASAAKASLTAVRHVCGSRKIQVANTKLLMDDSFSLSANQTDRIYFRENAPTSCWSEDDYEICVAPVLVCTAVKQTAGGGDNISAGGLMIQI